MGGWLHEGDRKRDYQRPALQHDGNSGELQSHQLRHDEFLHVESKERRFYNLFNDFGAASPAVIGRMAQRLARDRAAGMPESSEAVRGGTLHLMGLSYGNQFKQQGD